VAVGVVGSAVDCVIVLKRRRAPLALTTILLFSTASLGGGHG
jgi:hypothetical protein